MAMNLSGQQAVSPEPRPLIAVVCLFAVLGALAGLAFVFSAHARVELQAITPQPGIDWTVVGFRVGIPFAAAKFVLLVFGAYALNQRKMLGRTLILAGCTVACVDAIASVAFDFLWLTRMTGHSLSYSVRDCWLGLVFGCAFPLFTAFLATRKELRAWLASPVPN